MIESFGKTNEKGIAERLEVSLPSAWESIHRLEGEGLIKVERLKITFLPSGYREAMEIMKSHRITEAFVYSYLEVPWDESHEAVMQLEHDFSERMLHALYKNIGRPQNCPHGNPIIPNERMQEFKLLDMPDGNYRIVRQTFEKRELLRKLFNSGLIPEMPVRVEKFGSSYYLTGQNGEMKLPIGLETTVRLKKA